MPIDIYYHILSGPSLSVLYTAKHLKLDVNLKYLDMAAGQHKSPEYLKINPLGQVPAIDDNGFCFNESKAIMQYFCNQYAPDNDLYPKNPKERALVDRMLFFSVEFSTAAREVLIPKLFLEKEPAPEKVNALKEKFKLLNIYIGDNKYVAGKHLTIADLATITLAIVPVKMLNFDLSDYPNVKEWIERLPNECPYMDELAHEEAKLPPDYKEKMITAMKSRFEGQK